MSKMSKEYKRKWRKIASDSEDNDQYSTTIKYRRNPYKDLGYSNSIPEKRRRRSRSTT